MQHQTTVKLRVTFLCVFRNRPVLHVLFGFTLEQTGMVKMIDYDWNICFTTDDINLISSRFTESFLNLARQFIPNKVVTIRPHDKPWYNNVLRALRRRRDRLFHKARSNNTFDSWQNYRECRNFYVYELQSEKKEYEVRQSSKLDSPSIGGHSW